MTKRILSLLLCGLLVFGCLNVGIVRTSAASVTTELTKLAKKFPNGKYWNHVGSKVNNPDGYTDTPCTHHSSSACGILPGDCECNSFVNAIQCMGFAYKSAYDIVGTNPRGWNKSTELKPSALYVGDIIRYSGHSVTVPTSYWKACLKRTASGWTACGIWLDHYTSATSITRNDLFSID